MMSLQEKFYLCDLECRVKRAQEEMFEMETLYEQGKATLNDYIEARSKYKFANNEFINVANKFRNKR